jgi:carboxyl-terminal processing protease
MKLKRTILGPILVALFAIVSGGWLLHRSADADRTPYDSRVLLEILNRISNDYVDEHVSTDLYRMAVEGFLRELGDPHTSFMSAEDYARLRVQTTGEYGGLGIQIAERDGWITILSPLPGTPAERAGLQAGDRIVEVEGESAEGWSDDEAVRVLRGRPGTPVQIRVARPGVGEPLAFEIVREEIHVQSVPAAYMIEPGVGYARLELFSETSTQELRSAINRLRSEGMQRMVLDLRQNPGGLLDQGVSISDLFIEPGRPIVETRTRNPRDNVTFRSSRPEEFDEMLMVVLVDDFSASASEIVAGALQDHDRALVLGAPTFGKGSVQTLFPLSGGNYLKMTTGRWYTPAGRSIERDPGTDGVALIDDQLHLDRTGVVPAPERNDTTERRQYQTSGGRLVYGGGGIVPDLIVRPDTLTEAEREFWETVMTQSAEAYRSVVFSYAIEHVRDNPDLQIDFEITPAMEREIFERFRAAGVTVSQEEFEAARRLIDRDVGGEIARAKWGEAGRRQRANRADNVVRAAIELLQQASSQQALFSMVQDRARANR